MEGGPNEEKGRFRVGLAFLLLGDPVTIKQNHLFQLSSFTIARLGNTRYSRRMIFNERLGKLGFCFEANSVVECEIIIVGF